MARSTYVAKPEFRPTPQARRWLRKFFEYDKCGECLRGSGGHVAVSAAMGPFALCKPKAHDTLSTMQREVFVKRS